MEKLDGSELVEPEHPVREADLRVAQQNRSEERTPDLLEVRERLPLESAVAVVRQERQRRVRSLVELRSGGGLRR